jgi:hypothetical protein
MTIKDLLNRIEELRKYGVKVCVLDSKGCVVDTSDVRCIWEQKVTTTKGFKSTEKLFIC